MQKEEELILSKTAPLKSKINDLTAEVNVSSVTVEQLQDLPKTVSAQVTTLLAQVQTSSNDTLSILNSAIAQQQQKYNATLDDLRRQFQSQLNVLNSTLHNVLIRITLDRAQSNATISDFKDQLDVSNNAVRSVEQMLESFQRRANTSFQRQSDMLSTMEENVQIKLDEVRNDMIVLHPNETSIIVHNSSSKCILILYFWHFLCIFKYAMQCKNDFLSKAKIDLVLFLFVCFTCNP